MEIAALLTCHNRKEKTETCLLSLLNSLGCYNSKSPDIINIEIFLTDDGCTDGTAEVARNVFPDSKVLHVLKGDGNLYWAGGMRYCWREAMKRHAQWDYYLLLNDDTVLLENVFDELFVAEQYAKKHYGREGLVSGITCATNDPNKLTYGGDVITNRFLSTKKRLAPAGVPQLCDQTNANILLVPKGVVDEIGIFFEGYEHGHADTDYSRIASRKGIPVVLTANFCGKCDKDNTEARVKAEKVIGMTLKERKAYFNHPLHSTKEYLTEIRRLEPIRLPIVWIGRMLNLYYPKLYYKINGLR